MNRGSAAWALACAVVAGVAFALGAMSGGAPSERDPLRHGGDADDVVLAKLDQLGARVDALTAQLAAGVDRTPVDRTPMESTAVDENVVEGRDELAALTAKLDALQRSVDVLARANAALPIEPALAPPREAVRGEIRRIAEEYVANDQAVTRRVLLMSMQDVLRRFGRPDHIHALQNSTVWGWTLDEAAMDFEFVHDRVIRVYAVVDR